MELNILQDLQQDVKIFLLAPIIEAIFRLCFIYFFAPNKEYKGSEKRWYECFRFGFWWGMDLNAYVLLVSFVLVTLPSLWIDALVSYGDTIRGGIGVVYLFLLYVAFLGKLIFYYHYKDTYNSNLRLGRNADKRNLLDIFFNQNHGWWILLSLPVYIGITYGIVSWLLGLATVPVPTVSEMWLYVVINVVITIATVVFFYWMRYGGTLRHDQKPEWDTVPEVVKEDRFFAKACISDLVAFKLALRMHPQEILEHTDEESKTLLSPIMKVDDDLVQSIWNSMRRTAKGARIQKPKRIFLIIEESYSQFAFDTAYEGIPIAETGRKIRRQEHTVCIDNFLAGGLISQPSISSLFNGIYDIDLELNERSYFWQHALPTSLPKQLANLGYHCSLWYGGSLSWASLGPFGKAAGFHELYSGFDITPKGSPATWLGVYDHLFFEGIQKQLEVGESHPYEFHCIYTTSNHGPFKIPIEKYGFSKDTLQAQLPKHLQSYVADIGTYAYCDYYLNHFVEYLQDTYEGGLIIVTGDHTSRLPTPWATSDKVHTLREDMSTAFYMHHKELYTDMFCHDSRGCHMNILPTIMELIGAKGHEYFSLMPSLLEKQDIIVTPYHWMDENCIGFFRDQRVETLDGKPITNYEIDRVTQLQKAYKEVTGAIVRSYQ